MVYWFKVPGFAKPISNHPVSIIFGIIGIICEHDMHNYEKNNTQLHEHNLLTPKCCTPVWPANFSCISNYSHSVLNKYSSGV